MTRKDVKSKRTLERTSPEAGRPVLSSPQWQIYGAGWQEAVRFRVAVCGRRFGKALDIRTPIATPDGWSTMGELAPGDRVFDENGEVCRVVFTTEVMLGRPCFAMTFDDGSRIIADADHVWPVVSGVHGIAPTSLKTTTEIRNELQFRTLSVLTCAPLRNWPGGSRIADAIVPWSAHSGRVCGSEALLSAFQETLVRRGHVCRRVGDILSWDSPGKRFIISVEAMPSVATRCIQVDSPSRLYLCGRALIPTHNTFLMGEEIRRAAKLAVQQNVGPENEIWYGAPTFIQAKRVMWSRLKRCIPRHWLQDAPNETSCVMRLVSGHVIRVVGLDAFENLRGSGLWFFGGDEWADCRPEAWTEVIRPMLSTARGHALFIGTPKGFDHFRDLYLLGQSGGDPSFRSFLFTTLDGGNVPAEEVDAARRQLDPRTFRQEYGASFETYAGRVIYAFSRSESCCDRSLDRATPVHVGMDFNVNPMTATVWQEIAGVSYQIDEIILPTSNTDEMVEELIRRYGKDSFDPGRKTLDHVTIYPDPAGAQRRSSAAGRTDIGILREAGFKVVALASHPPVRDRMNIVNRRFLSADGTRHAFIDRKCVKSIEALERLVYREGTGQPDKSLGHDHLVDATGYYMFGRLALTGSIQDASLSIMER